MLTTFTKRTILHNLLITAFCEAMGQNESSFKQTYEETVSQLSSVQMGEISRRFNELYAKAGGPKGHVVDREAFSKYFNLPVAVGDRLFDAFDEKKVSVHASTAVAWSLTLCVVCLKECTFLIIL